MMVIRQKGAELVILSYGIFPHAFLASRNTPKTLTSFLVSIHLLPRESAHLKQKRTTHFSDRANLSIGDPLKSWCMDLRLALSEFQYNEASEHPIICIL